MLEKEGEALEKDVEALRGSVFAFHQTRCVGCGLPTELPMLHFLCGHSYHKRCVAAPERGCPTCGCAVEKTKPLSDEEFLRKVSVVPWDDEKMTRCENGFAVVADCFAQHAFDESETEEESAEVDAPALPALPAETETGAEALEEIDEDAIPIQTLEL